MACSQRRRSDPGTPSIGISLTSTLSFGGCESFMAGSMRRRGRRARKRSPCRPSCHGRQSRHPATRGRLHALFGWNDRAEKPAQDRDENRLLVSGNVWPTGSVPSFAWPTSARRRRRRATQSPELPIALPPPRQRAVPPKKDRVSESSRTVTKSAERAGDRGRRSLATTFRTPLPVRLSAIPCSSGCHVSLPTLATSLPR